MDHDEAGAERLDLREYVGGHDDSPAVFDEIPENRPELHNPRGVYPDHGLVEDEDPWRPHHCLPDTEPLDHPFAEFGYLVVLVLDEADLLQQYRELAVRLLAGEPELARGEP